MFELVELFKYENRKVLIKLCKCIKLAFNYRNSLIRYSRKLEYICSSSSVL